MFCFVDIQRAIHLNLLYEKKHKKNTPNLHFMFDSHMETKAEFGGRCVWDRNKERDMVWGKQAEAAKW